MTADSHQHLQTIWAWRKWLALFVVVVTVVTYVISNRQTPTYEATALAQLVPAGQDAGQVVPADALQSLANTYLRIAQTADVYDEAAQSIGGATTGHDVKSHVDIDPETGSTIFDMLGTDTSRSLAVKYANAYANAFSTYVNRLQTAQRSATIGAIQAQIDKTATAAERANSTLSESQLRDQLRALQTKLSNTVAAPTDSVRVIGTAAPPNGVASPHPKRDAALAFITALLLGAGAILLYMALADRYRDSDEAVADLGLPLLGEIPAAELHEQVAIEAFRHLRTVIGLELATGRGGNAPPADRDGDAGGATVLLVTAAERGAGKSYTTAGISRSLAIDGRRTVAVDGDLRRPTLHVQLDVHARPGLSDLLEDPTRAVDTVTQRAPEKRHRHAEELDVIASGGLTTESTERFASERMSEVLAELGERHDYIVCDSSPIMPVVDAIVLARHATGVVLVVDARRSRRRDARRAVQTLRVTGVHVLGIVFNRTPSTSATYTYGGQLEPERRPGRAETVR